MPETKKDAPEKKTNPHAGHRERMRERFYKNGLEGFSDHEILEFLLFYVYAQKNTNEIGHALIQQFGSLTGVLDAEYEELVRVKGVGDRAAMLIKLLPEMFRRYNHGNDTFRCLMLRAEARCNFYRNYLCDRKQEVVCLGCLNDQMWQRNVFEIASGTPDHVHIEPQKLMRIALASGCSNFVLAHNHPVGKAAASYEDIVTTDTIAHIFKSVQLNLVDHIIVAGNKSISMKQTGAYFNE